MGCTAAVLACCCCCLGGALTDTAPDGADETGFASASASVEATDATPGGPSELCVAGGCGCGCGCGLGTRVWAGFDAGLLLPCLLLLLPS
jgi:hypothetical protein